MPDRYDAIVIGAGPGGEVAIERLAKGGLSVALVERELIGGECAYWACIPSKTLLRPPEARAEAERAAGLDRPEQRWEKVAAYRDFMVRNLDDSAQSAAYRDQGVDVYKGEAALAGPGTVEVGGEMLTAERIVIATGSDPAIPPIDGLDESGYWTNREATALSELPESVVVLGGGPVGTELGQFLRRFGVEVTIVQGAPRLLEREEPAASELLGGALREEGVELRLDVQAEAVKRANGRCELTLSDGAVVSGEKLLVATGRRPRLPGGLEQAGIEAGKRGIEVDERCRAEDGVWAIGDVTGAMPFTHVAKYQGRIAAQDLMGRPARVSYAAIPRVVFTDPEVAAVGLTTAQAREQGIELVTSRIKLPEVLARPWTYEQNPRGELGLLADREHQVLVGAWAVAPLAGEWIHQAALAIKAELPLAMLRDTVAQFPTFSEGYLMGLEALAPSD